MPVIVGAYGKENKGGSGREGYQKNRGRQATGERWTGRKSSLRVGTWSVHPQIQP